MADQVAVLAGGCFWCTEAVFLDVVGVKSVESGYTGGKVANPTYKQVCGGDTGHAEAIRITFDPDEISYDDLLDIFFATHDPTQLNRQGNDVGTQYRSAIFPQNEEQERRLAKGSNVPTANNGGRRGHDDRAAGRVVPRRGLSPGLLVRRRAAKSLLHGHHPAQAAEAPEELSGTDEKRGRGCLGRGPAQPIVDRCAKALVRDRSDGDRVFRRCVRLMQADRTVVQPLRRGRPED